MVATKTTDLSLIAWNGRISCTYLIFGVRSVYLNKHRKSVQQIHQRSSTNLPYWSTNWYIHKIIKTISNNTLQTTRLVHQLRANQQTHIAYSPKPIGCISTQCTLERSLISVIQVQSITPRIESINPRADDVAPQALSAHAMVCLRSFHDADAESCTRAVSSFRRRVGATHTRAYTVQLSDLSLGILQTRSARADLPWREFSSEV